MASFEETALVLQEVAQIFSQDDDAQAIREILALQRDIAALREDQQQQLAQTALGVPNLLIQNILTCISIALQHRCFPCVHDMV
jgi:hypothetical protein